MKQTGTERPRQGIGIDIGGTKMAVALVNEPGDILQREVLGTEADRGFGRAIERLGDTITALLQKEKADGLVGIGIGCAGPVDPLRGLINNPYTLTGWDRCDAVTPLRQRFGVPVYLENDADAAAIGECACGAGTGFDPVVLLTFGTGVGGAAVVGGQVYRGVNGEHPELGHMVVSSEGPECYCGARGCLESLASGSALAAAGEKAGYLDARAVFAAAEKGQPEASGLVQRALEATCTAAWTLCHTFLPQRLILGGGMMDHQYDFFANALRRRLSRATQFSHQSVSIARAALGNDAGMVGAGRMAIARAATQMDGKGKPAAF